MIVFENEFSAIIRQSQQSSIATAPLRLPLNCGDRSIPIGVKFCLVNMYDWATVGDFSGKVAVSRWRFG